MATFTQRRCSMATLLQGPRGWGAARHHAAGAFYGAIGYSRHADYFRKHLGAD